MPARVKDRTAEDIYLLSPNTGDVIVITAPEAAQREDLVVIALQVKQRLAEEGIRPAFIIADTTMSVDRIPAQALTEQGYMLRDAARSWVARNVPLALQAATLAKFDAEFNSAQE